MFTSPPGIGAFAEPGGLDPEGTCYASDPVLGFDATDLGPPVMRLTVSGGTSVDQVQIF